jgi:hypothetical protein
MKERGAIESSNRKTALPSRRLALPIPARTSEVEQHSARFRRVTEPQGRFMTFGGFPAKCLMLRIYATIDTAVTNGGTNSSNSMGTGAPMDTFRSGRKLNLPSTIAIKHQVRMLMADDRAKKAEEEARAQSNEIPQMKVGLERLTT